VGDLSTTENKVHEVGAFRRAVDRVVGGYQRFRAAVGRNWIVDLTFRIAVGVVGFAVVVLGIVALPAPGPGWAIIFLGLGILATEFEGARRILVWVRTRYQAWVHWLARQRPATRFAVSAGILLLVVACAWFVGAFAVVASWLRIDWLWLRWSPVASYFGL
jgi:uncharacterized protein (TIGR02611 family)